MWVDSGEGPWRTRDEAEAFAEAEVGMKWRIIKKDYLKPSEATPWRSEFLIEVNDPDHQEGASSCHDHY